MVDFLFCFQGVSAYEWFKWFNSFNQIPSYLFCKYWITTLDNVMKYVYYMLMYLSIQTITNNNLNSPYIFDRKERLTTHCILNAVISECLKNQCSLSHPRYLTFQLKWGEIHVGIWVENTLTCSVVLQGVG